MTAGMTVGLGEWKLPRRCWTPPRCLACGCVLVSKIHKQRLPL